MKNLYCLAAAMAAGALSFAAGAAAPNAVENDAEIHKIVLENEFVRVFDARASHGATSPMHTHQPMVLVSLGKARFRITTPDGKKQTFELNPGQTLWVPGAEHSWELLAGELHAVGVEIKSAQQEGAPPAPVRAANDAVTLDPDVHHVLFENPHVRVFEGRVLHPRSSPMHSHPPSVYVSQDWVRLKLTLEDGKTLIHDFYPGQVLWFPEGGTHSWETIAGGGRVIGIEVKAAQAAMK